MSRAHKFRVWDDINKKWMLGYEYPNLGGFSMQGETMLFGEYNQALSSFKLEELDKMCIDYWVGEKDLNNKDVYEGDIFIGYEERNGERLSGKYIVVWEDCGFTAQSLDENGCDAFLGFFFSNPTTIPQTAIEVIGNIHENPELLLTLTTEEVLSDRSSKYKTIIK